MRRLDGSYVLTPVTGDGDRTLVTYHLDVEVVVPLPGFVKRRAESKIIHTALRELRDHVESCPSPTRDEGPALHGQGRGRPDPDRRSEERRGGKEGVSTCRSRVAAAHLKKI